ncbi:DUF721 domain-containing protein [Mesobaculum littorinae]|uniref:DUF721 domain-containing protein n=2 Tax=Mesobaculum littorinae TaxID=2486419 RepID=A0A438AHP2_9RHOB|nr:DciA family protein [Mesobaculum littorinae]RVV98243.1 DUF721 domain-containing protein [Mesobaculum littorinae]
MAEGSTGGRQRRGGRGFRQTGTLLERRIREAGESRGFAITRLLTHWDEIVGTDTAGMARPADVSYGRKGFGATLTLLTTGAMAPMLEMQKEKIRERVNACYGYAAISRVRITQTAPQGFAEGKPAFAHAPKQKPRPTPEAEARITKDAAQAAAPVGDEGLRTALEALARNVLAAKHKT